MRIITGSAKGLKLKTPQGLDIRPTSDKVKGSVFNILAGKIVDSAVADLFAGTGNLGLEALSRGAVSAVFVDNSLASINLLKQNLALTKLIDQAEILKTDVLTAIDKFIRQNRRFDLIFCDPPYNRGLVSAVIRRIDNSSLLQPEGIIIMEHSKHEIIPLDVVNLQVKRYQSYGETLVSFISNNQTGGYQQCE